MSLNNAVEGVIDTIDSILREEMKAAFHDRAIDSEEFDMYCGQIDVLERVAEKLLGREVACGMRSEAEWVMKPEIEKTKKKIQQQEADDANRTDG